MIDLLLSEDRKKSVTDEPVVDSQPHLSRFKNISSDKLRGGYYTSESVARWLSSWAIQSQSDCILEPSSGDGVFVEMAARRLKVLGASSKNIREQISAIEIIEAEAGKVRNRLASVLADQEDGVVEQGDFFSLWPELKKKKVDCVLGNPPFIRYQNFPESSRVLAMTIMESVGLKPNRMTNIWVPFVVAAMECLKPGGRLAMVLPAELLQVTYAGQLRSFLSERFEKIDLVACNDLFFENAQQEVVLIMAHGFMERSDPENSCRMTLTEMKDVAAIVKSSPEKMIARASPKKLAHNNEKWLKYFLSAREISFMRRLRESPDITMLSKYASVEVGVVTGKNQFFVIDDEVVDKYKLREHTLPLVGRSSQLKGAVLSIEEWRELGNNQKKVYLFTVDPEHGGALSSDVRDYIQYGEESGFHKGYKCSIRKQWYTVPSLWIPDAFFFRQIYDFPRVILNTANATSTDTIHRMRCAAPAKKIARSLYTHLTAASAEIEGRSYGGGVLELEPNEARRLLMPVDIDGGMDMDECDRLIRLGKLQNVLDENDRLILISRAGLSQNDCLMLRKIWEKMRNRRTSRKKKS